MLRNAVIVVAALTAGVMTVSAQALAPSQAAKSKSGAPADAKVIELLALSGVRNALVESSGAYERQLKNGVPEHVLKEKGGALEKALRKSLDPMRLTFFISKEVAGSMNDVEVAAVAKWYASPLGRKVVGNHEKGIKLMRDERAMTTSAQQEAAKQSPARAGLIADLVKASREGELMADMAIKVGRVSAEKMSDPGTPPQMIQFFIKSMEDKRASMSTRYESLAISRMTVEAKSLTDAELREVAAFERTEAKRKFMSAISKGTAVGVLDALDRLAAASKPRVAQR